MTYHTIRNPKHLHSTSAYYDSETWYITATKERILMHLKTIGSKDYQDSATETKNK